MLGFVAGIREEVHEQPDLGGWEGLARQMASEQEEPQRKYLSHNGRDQGASGAGEMVLDPEVQTLRVLERMLGGYIVTPIREFPLGATGKQGPRRVWDREEWDLSYTFQCL